MQAGRLGPQSGDLVLEPRALLAELQAVLHQLGQLGAADAAPRHELGDAADGGAFPGLFRRWQGRQDIQPTAVLDQPRQLRFAGPDRRQGEVSARCLAQLADRLEIRVECMGAIAGGDESS